MAMQSLLPGLTFAAERSIELLNEVRTVLSLPPAKMHVGELVRRGRPPGTARTAPPANPAIHEAPRAKKKAAVGRKMSAAQGKEVGRRTRERWEIVREAGLKPKGGSPTNAEVMRALKIVEKKKNARTAAA